MTLQLLESRLLLSPIPDHQRLPAVVASHTCYEIEDQTLVYFTSAANRRSVCRNHHPLQSKSKLRRPAHPLTTGRRLSKTPLLRCNQSRPLSRPCRHFELAPAHRLHSLARKRVLLRNVHLLHLPQRAPENARAHPTRLLAESGRIRPLDRKLSTDRICNSQSLRSPSRLLETRHQRRPGESSRSGCPRHIHESR